MSRTELKKSASSETAIVAISRKGAALGRTLAATWNGDTTLYLDRRFLDDAEGAVAFDLPARPLVQRVFSEHQQLVLFMPVGAAVRLLAHCLEHKHSDPAVVCVDDAGRFAVSLLSGHVGGADRLTKRVAEILGATAVVTSASDVTGALAVDLLGQEFGWKVEADSITVTRASAAVINGYLTGVYQETGEPNWWEDGRPLPDNILVCSSLASLAEAPCYAALIVTDRQRPTTGEQSFTSILPGKPVVLYRPRSLVVGLGCRRGVPMEELEQLLDEAFRENNLAKESIRCIATAELKRDEIGIGLLADKLGVPVCCYDAAELNSVFDDQGESGPTPSPEAHRLLGIWGVSEPAALLTSGANELLVTKKKAARATIAVARVPFGDQ